MGGSISHVADSMANRMVPTPQSVSFLYVENSTKQVQKVFRKHDIFLLFLKEHQKKLLKQNSQVGGFYFPGTAFNDESNGTNPASVSFLYVENLTK